MDWKGEFNYSNPSFLPGTAERADFPLWSVSQRCPTAPQCRAKLAKAFVLLNPTWIFGELPLQLLFPSECAEGGIAAELSPKIHSHQSSWEWELQELGLSCSVNSGWKSPEAHMALCRGNKRYQERRWCSHPNIDWPNLSFFRDCIMKFLLFWRTYYSDLLLIITEISTIHVNPNLTTFPVALTLFS